MQKAIMPFTLLVLMLIFVLVLSFVPAAYRKARQERFIETEETITLVRPGCLEILDDKNALTSIMFVGGVSIGPDEIEMMSVAELQHLTVLINLCKQYSANAELTEMFGKKLLPLYFKQSYLAESGVEK